MLKSSKVTSDQISCPQCGQSGVTTDLGPSMGKGLVLGFIHWIILDLLDKPNDGSLGYKGCFHFNEVIWGN